MKRTVQEKYEYNKRRKGLFSSGYVVGVNLYKDYLKQDKEGKDITEATINICHANALFGDEFGKGVMCGYRDKANERKEKLSFTSKYAPRRGDKKDIRRRQDYETTAF